MAVYQTLTLKEIGVDTLANTSQVQILWKSQQTGPSHNDNIRTAKYWVTLNGTKTEHTVSYTLPEKTTKTILNETITVLHQEDGTGAVKVETWMDTRISAGVIELTKSLALTPIPRASTIGATDANVESTSLIAVSRKSEEYTHSISVSFGDLRGYLDADGSLTDTEIRHTVTNIPFFIPESFYFLMTDVKSRKCNLICRTYQGNTQIGTDQTATFTVTAREDLCKPDIYCSVLDCNPNTLALTGNPETLVRYMSTARCECIAKAKNGAAVTEVSINGQVTEGIMELRDVESGTFMFSSRDSRGYYTNQIVSAELIPYIPVTLNAKVTRTDPTSGKGILEAKGQCYGKNFGITANRLLLHYSINEMTEGVVEPIISDDGLSYTVNVEISGLEYLSTNRVVITLSDLLSEKTQTVTVKPGIPVFDWGEKDFAFHVPVDMSNHRITAVKAPVEDTDAANKAYVDGKISISKVWENSNPLIAFDAQTLDLQFSEGDLAQVFLAEGIDAEAVCSVTVQYGKKGRAMGTYGEHISRRVVSVLDSGVTISAGNRTRAYGDWVEANFVLIPLSIYKITGSTDLTNTPEIRAICGTFLCGEAAAGQ